MHVSLYCIYVSNTPSICYDMHVSMYCIHVSLSSMTCMSVCTACMSLTSLMIYVCQPGYGSTANDNFNQRAKVYCYLKATYPGGDFTAEGRQGLGVLKRLSNQWASANGEEEEAVTDGVQAQKKAKRVPWGDKAAALAKRAAEGL